MNEAQKGWVKLAEMYSHENPTTWQELKDKHGVELLISGVKYSNGELNSSLVGFCDCYFKEILNGEKIWFVEKEDSILIDSETDRDSIDFDSMTQSPKFDQEPNHIIHNGVKYFVEDNNGRPELVKAGHKAGDVVPLSETKKGDRFMVYGVCDEDGYFMNTTPEGTPWRDIKKSERTVIII